MKIYLFDAWKLKFMKPVLEHWRAQGHEVQHDIWWSPDRVEWSELSYFYPVQHNLKRASTEMQKPPGARVVAEAVDVDIYHTAGWKGIDWSFVDVLVCMSTHMIDFMRRNGLPDSVKVIHVPGGVDLDKWTLRTGPQGYNVAWVGHYWIAKNLFGALQIFNQLIQQDRGNPWRLFVRAQKWSPNWWQAHCEAYLADNPRLAERVTLVEQRVPDLNTWLDDKDFLLSTSFKEAFGYVIAEAAAKGIRPVIEFTNGVRDIWPDEWVFSTHNEAVRYLTSDIWYTSHDIRDYIVEHYPLSQRLEMLDEICFGDLKNV